MWIHWRRRVRPDHPHGRGENVDFRESEQKVNGPSPRAWGEQRPPGTIQPGSRTIPTGVGRTVRRKMCVTIRTDHPHGRGENAASCMSSNGAGGPSPRAWGERDVGALLKRDARTIPTGVGRTEAQRGFPGSLADHPHGRGENFSAHVHAARECGPSPRAWGEPPKRWTGPRGRRTIPTGVGRTRARRASCTTCSDHPHGRGENDFTATSTGLLSGPSPRAWGEPFLWRVTRGYKRTIPTGVGRTYFSAISSRVIPDHPHGRGENTNRRGS